MANSSGESCYGDAGDGWSHLHMSVELPALMNVQLWTVVQGPSCVTNGEFQKQIEIERGRGPGEVQHITDFDICKNKLWIVDSENLMIHSYSVETGGYLESYPVDNRPSRIACLEDGLIIQWSQSEYLFSKFDYEGNLIIEFGEIIEDQTQNMFSVHGNIQSNGKDRFVYIPFYASLIYHFNGEGELIQIMQTPDGLEFPVTRSEERIRYAPEHIYMRDGVIDKNKIIEGF